MKHCFGDDVAIQWLETRSTDEREAALFVAAEKKHAIADLVRAYLLLLGRAEQVKFRTFIRDVFLDLRHI